jgi:uncharacterized membrane protein YcaP (DUF421 family)
MAYLLWAESSWLHVIVPAVPVLEKVVRTVLVYAFIVIGIRVFGKRELAQLNPFDFVVLIMLSNTVQNAVIGEDNSVIGGLIGALTLLTVNYLVVRFLFGHRRLDQLLAGEPTVLVKHGKVIQSALAKELVTESELLSVLHRQGFGNLGEVERCVLEPGGVFAVEGKEPRQSIRQHKEVMARLDALSHQVEALRNHLARS